jgi:hypothetical protein
MSGTQNFQRQNLDVRDRLFLCLPTGHRPRDGWDFGNPATADFLFPVNIISICPLPVIFFRFPNFPPMPSPSKPGQDRCSDSYR